MIPTTNHIYSCTWEPDGGTYFNLVTGVTSTCIIGRCVSSTDSTYFNDCPEGSKGIKWILSYWNEDSPDATITDLGHVDDLSEFFI